MRGTPAMTVGLTLARFSEILGTRPSVAVAKPTWYCAASSTLPKTCDSGNHRKWTSSLLTTSRASMLAPMNTQLLCGSSTPLGRPVVPDV